MLALRNRNNHPFGALNKDVNHLFSDFFGGFESPAPKTNFPAMNIYEEADNVVIEAQVPGFTLEGIDIDFANNILTITGTKNEPKEENKTFHWKEIRSDGFTRSIKLGFEIDASKASAELTQGLLKITLPKHEAVKARTIKVKAGK